MDGSIAVTSSDRLRNALRQQFTPSSSSDTRIQGLFEQLLKIPATPIDLPAASQDDPSAPIEDELKNQSAGEEVTAKSTTKVDEKDKDEEPEEEASDDGSSVIALTNVPVLQPIATDGPKEKENASPVLAKDCPIECEGEAAARSELPNVTAPVQQAIQAATPVETDEAKATIEPSSLAPSPIDASPVEVAETKPIAEVPEVEPVHAVSSEVASQESLRPVELKDREVQHATAQSDVPNQQAVTTSVEESLASDQTQPEFRDQKQSIESTTNPDESQPVASIIQPTSADSKENSQEDRREKWYQRTSEPLPVDAGSVGNESSVHSEAEQTTTDWTRQLDTPIPDPTKSNDLATSATSTQTASSLVNPSSFSVPVPSASSLAPASSEDGSRRVTNGHAANSIAARASASNTTGTGATTTSRLPPSATTSPGSSGESDATNSLTQAERVRLVQRVARSFNRLGPEGGQLSLKLHPPELGVVNITVKMDGNTLSAKLQAESTQAQQVLMDNLPVLKERLSEQGVEVTKFQVEVVSSEEMSNNLDGQNSSEFNGGSSDSNGSQSREIDYRRLARSTMRSSTSGVDASSRTSGAWYPNAQGQLAMDQIAARRSALRSLDVQA